MRRHQSLTSPRPLDGRHGAALPPAWRALALLWLAAAVLSTALPSQAWRADALASAASRLGPGARDAVAPLQALMAALQQGPEIARLTEANRFFNVRIAFGEDRDVWGQDDYWASPLEALNRGAGDCEDYAIAKYLSLVSSGMPSARLRLVYVRARTGAPGEPPGGQAHMVLAYYAEPTADPLILDNLVPEIRPASDRPDLTPVFSFNGEGLWQGVGGSRAGDPLVRLSRWRAVLQKAHAEGFQ